VATIERLHEDDWRRYRDLRLASLADAPLAFGSTYERERERTPDEWRGRLASRVQFVAFEGEVAVGTVGIRDAAQGDGGVELVSMWVAPGTRGSGVADALVGAVLELARREEAGIVTLWVSAGNTIAERLYARHGFRRTGRTQPIDDDHPARGDELEMALHLSDGDDPFPA
jgi:ribosomal protein S18 acetylase RimI-like enzyme